MTFQNHPVVCTDCRRLARYEADKNIWTCPICCRQVTDETVDKKLGGGEIRHG